MFTHTHTDKYKDLGPYFQGGLPLGKRGAFTEAGAEITTLIFTARLRNIQNSNTNSP